MISTNQLGLGILLYIASLAFHDAIQDIKISHIKNHIENPANDLTPKWYIILILTLLDFGCSIAGIVILAIGFSK